MTGQNRSPEEFSDRRRSRADARARDPDVYAGEHGERRSRGLATLRTGKLAIGGITSDEPRGQKLDRQSDSQHLSWSAAALLAICDQTEHPSVQIHSVAASHLGTHQDISLCHWNQLRRRRRAVSNTSLSPHRPSRKIPRRT